MASENQHTIDTLLIEVSLSSRDDKDSVSQAIKKAVQSTLHNLEGIMDRYFDDSFYRLDQLVIEMDMHKDDLEELGNQLEKELAARLESLHDSIEKEQGASSGGVGVTRHSPGERFVQLLDHFLKTGSFPWWAGESLSQVEDWLENLSSEEWLDVIHPLYQNHKGVTKRLAAQFPKSLIQNLIRKTAAYSPQSASLIQYIRETEHFADTLDLPYGLNSKLSTSLYEITLHGLISDRSTSSILGDLTRETLSRISPAAADRKAILESWKNRLEKTGKKYTRQWIEALNETSNIEQKTGDKTGDEISDHNVALSEFQVTQAGLVLLHPFLSGLFNNLGLLEEGRFKDESSHERAVCLLNYLATGNETFEEQTLALPKFLAGWPLSDTIDRFLPISNYEKDECITVLNSAIRHWPVLKNTSAEGLQVNFLQRKGMLKEEELGWSLYVEHKTRDILLEKLPWGISIVKLKWMDKMLTVHW